MTHEIIFETTDYYYNAMKDLKFYKSRDWCQKFQPLLIMNLNDRHKFRAYNPQFHVNR